ncbi:hypothetical protein FHW88_005192 [Mucilaginibacter sp. SG538B]|uniref:hypothetical protein n=1 Tax=Mucilaginibacter sp. SG538B TaxID=2587021 RepID=UPI00159DE6EF|nr:hypothetical protein [Mucilaginibacter sp. SG538B]NVM66874.1 hypothetical protein [Mucilaginibacter sp. SG538B]
MKKILSLTFFCLTCFMAFGQADSVQFKLGVKTETKSSLISKIKINNVDVATDADNSKYFSINSTCNFSIPKYSTLTGGGTFVFRRIKTDAQGSLSAFGSSLSFDKKSDFYVFYFARSKSYECDALGQKSNVSFGVGVYVIFKISEVKSNIKINTVYDISAAGQLGLARIELDVRTYGMTPSLQNEFIPEKLANIAIESAQYFDKIVGVAKNSINDTNTECNTLPIAI